MAKTIKYSVGIQTFRKIREGNYLYVDKTAFIEELKNDSDYVFLSRPRRFGKSLLMSTLEAYFRGEKELFEGLAISEIEKEWVSYPVFRIDMSPEAYVERARVVARLDGIIREIEDKYDLKADGDSPATKFQSLIRKAVKKTGQKVVILIDEYDKPLLDCLHKKELHEAIKEELRGFYSVLKANDEYLRFVMLTGVTKFGKVSIFSGLNNLKDISMLPKYNGICGITETEFHRDFVKSVKEFSETNGIREEETWKESKRLYDGYHFARTGEGIYNPFSVLSAFDSEEFNQYWFTTGSPSYLLRIIRENGFITTELEGERRKESALIDISEVGSDIVPLLYQSGYLTLKGYDRLTKEYTLGFPNQEVYEGFWDSMANYLFKYHGKNTFDIYKFLKEIREGNADGFMERLQTLFCETESDHEMKKEIHFQNMMATTCKMLGMIVRTEIHSGQGRCDMEIETANHIFVFEFKVNGSAEAALKQIKEKEYWRRHQLDGRKISLIGANFSTETRTFTDWKVEKV